MLNTLKTLLETNNLTISVAESCTGGNLQALMTSESGASNFFEGGITCYNINQKVKHLNVDRNIAEKCDCISIEVAEQMAIGCNTLFNSNISISTTGYITEHLFYSIAINDEIFLTEEIDLSNFKSRTTAQKAACIDILFTLIKVLKNKYAPEHMI
jgi:nicotinamide-nucleotide amidase